MKPFLFLALAALSGCMTTTFPTTELTGEDTNFGDNRLVGQSFGGKAVSFRFGSAEQTDFAVTVESSSSARVTLEGDSSFLSTLASGDDETFATLGEQETLNIGTRLVGGPITPDVLYFFFTDRPPPSIGEPRVTFFIGGNQSSTRNLPSNVVRYSGATAMYAGNNRTANGRITLDVNFSDASFDATLTNSNPFDASSVMTVTEGIEANGELSGIISGSGVLTGTLTGDIYGAGANQAAGTLLVATPSGGVVGTFGAID